MKNKTVLINALVLTVALFDLTGRPAHAYLDPGIGSQTFQIGLAGALGLLYVTRTTISRVIDTVRQRLRR